ncbi:MAG: hypothetical protein R6V83_08210 [Candidatus Thorarchaeota archaeon]
MSSRINKLKAFLYFGGAFVILFGGAIVLMAPYHYVGLMAREGHVGTFEIWDRPGYYPEFEVSVSINAENVSSNIMYVDFLITNNATSETKIINMTLDEQDRIEDSDPPKYVDRETIDLEPGNYTILLANIDGPTIIDIGYKQISDSRLFIVTGGSLNIIGLVMCIVGYCVGGNLLGTGEEAIVDWGYEQEIGD